MTLGIDMVDVTRLRASLRRSPRLEERLFTKGERRYCFEKPDPVMHLAGTLAAKEAVIKALRLGRLVEWCSRIEILRGEGGAPGAVVTVDDGPVSVEISISHERSMAIAVALTT
jgi:holo-[acyl-carrier protein] synthase